MLWDEKKLARLLELANAGGRSAVGIAAVLSAEYGEPCTRNAVLGRLYRMELRDPACRMRTKAPRRKYNTRANPVDIPEAMKPPPAPEPVSEAEKVPPVRLLDRRDTQCPYPCDEYTWPDFLSCGAAKDITEKYCAAHMRLTHNASAKPNPVKTEGKWRRVAIASGFGAGIDLRDAE